MAEHPLCFVRKVLIFVCVIFMLSHVGGIYENLTFCILVCDIFVSCKNDNSQYLLFFRTRSEDDTYKNVIEISSTKSVEFICPSTSTYPPQLYDWQWKNDVKTTFDNHLWRSDSEEDDADTTIEETSSSDQVQMDILIQMYRTQCHPKKFSNQSGVKDKESICLFIFLDEYLTLRWSLFSSLTVFFFHFGISHKIVLCVV